MCTLKTTPSQKYLQIWKILTYQIQFTPTPETTTTPDNNATDTTPFLKQPTNHITKTKKHYATRPTKEHSNYTKKNRQK